jgi:DNA invertase Pin-like site-specific DNA recombinase
MEKANRSIILARVSSKSQEDEGYSLDSQVKLLHGYCANNDLLVVKVFKISETASKQQSRKIFHELLVYLERNNICHLAIEKTDRLTRNMKDAVAIDEWLEKDGDRVLHAVKENIRLHKDSKSDVKFMWNIHLAVAKKYADNLREEAMKGWAEKLAQGWLPGVPPPGYKTITQNNKRIHIPNPDTQYLVKKSFEFYLQQSESINSTAEYMKVIGLTTRKGRPFSKSNVQKILINPFYIGLNRHNGVEYPGAQETFIPESLFNKVQAKMNRKIPGGYKKHNPVFKNMITCEICNGVVTWQFQKGRFYGACQRRSEKCKGRRLLKEEDIESLVEEKLEKLICPSEDVIDWLVAEMRIRHEEDINKTEACRRMLNQRLERIDRMQSNLYDDKLAGDISKDQYDQKSTKLKLERLNTESELKNVAINASLQLERKVLLLELSQIASKIYKFKAPDAKRMIMTKLFDEITHEEDSISVKYTEFSKFIAQNVRKTKELMKGQI